MSAWHLRDLTDDDLEEVVALDGVSSSLGQRALFPLSEVVAALVAGQPAVGAIAAGQLVGTAAGRVEQDRGWVLRIALHPEWRGQGLGSELLIALEQRLVERGVRRMTSALPTGETGTVALRNAGFVARTDITWFDKVKTVRPQDVDVAASLGGYVPRSDLWQQMAGMAQEKALLDRRIVLPLAQPALAEEHGVREPRAVMLFGPPGTGKTTFAKAIASRLGWPFVELFPSRLAASDLGLAGGISAAFAAARRMEHVLVFIDEVEEIASDRAGQGVAIGVVNELLKSIVTFRERDHRLLVCATNSVGSLDPAFLRHGRFDFVLPVGPPDPVARQALWRSATAQAGGNDVDVDELVAASEHFTPADITHAAQQVAAAAFEQTLRTGRREHASTADYLDAVAATRPTLTAQDVEAFREDIARYERA